MAKFFSTIKEEKIGLVVHDGGGMIGIAGAMKAGKKIDGLVVMNTAITAPKDGFKPTWFHSLSQVPLISSFLFRGLNFPLSFLNRFSSVLFKGAILCSAFFINPALLLIVIPKSCSGGRYLCLKKYFSF